MATGAYANSIGELDIDIPGEDYTYNGNIRKKTENFIYTATSISASNYLALSFRIPMYQIYYISILKTNGKLRCILYDGTANAIQKKLCAQLDTAGTI